MAKPRTPKPKPTSTPTTIEQALQAGVAQTISEILAKHQRPALAVVPQLSLIPKGLRESIVEASVQTDRADVDDAWRALDNIASVLRQLADLVHSPELHDLAHEVERLADPIYKRACDGEPLLGVDDLDLGDVGDSIRQCPKGDLPWRALRNFLSELGEKCDSAATEVLTELQGAFDRAEAEFSQRADASELSIEERIVWHLWAGNGGKPVSVAMIAIDRGIPKTDVNVAALTDSDLVDQIVITTKTKGGQPMDVPHYQPTMAWVRAVMRHEEPLPAKPPHVQQKR